MIEYDDDMVFHSNPNISRVGQYSADCWAANKTNDEILVMARQMAEPIPKGVTGNASHRYAWMVTLETILQERREMVNRIAHELEGLL